MSTYNLQYTSGMAQIQNIYFYENLTSLTGEGTLTDKNLTFLLRGRKTNWIRTIAAYPTDNGDFTDPVYTSNDRYWVLKLTVIYPTVSNRASYDGAVTSGRLAGNICSPVNEIYDIDIYYGDSNSLNTVPMTKIEGLNLVLNVTVDDTFFYLESDNPASGYTEYTSNDLVAYEPFNNGRPNESQNIYDAQYGTTTWEIY